MSSLYLDLDLEPHLVSVGGTASLVGAEARHAAVVNRVRVGEIIAVGNGRGLTVRGPAVAVSHELVTFSITDMQSHEAARPGIWLVQALAKGGRDESAVQAACELGIDGVIPWSAQRSIVKWERSKVQKGQERWSAIVREASKQSIRSFLPEVAPLVTTKQLALLAVSTRMLVLSPDASAKLTAVTPDERDLVVVVGPEGGVSHGEISLLVAAGAETVRLGDTVLRTGTAGPAAISALNVILGRW